MAPILTSTGLVLLGVLWCLAAARVVRGGRPLALILLGAYALRVGLAIGLYVASAYQLPVLASLQLSRITDGSVYAGFWRFAWDAPAYHQNGIRIATALRAGQPLPPILIYGKPFVVESTDFFYLVGHVYWLLGAHPLYVPLLNGMLWTGTCVVAYALARRLRGDDAARVAAVLVGFWPSGIMWSSQILKDSLMVLLLLLSVFLATRVWEGRVALALVAGALLAGAIFELTRIRAYEAGVLIAAVVLALAVTSVVRLRALRLGSVIRGLALVLVLVLAHAAGRGTLHGRLVVGPPVEFTEVPPPPGPPSVFEQFAQLVVEPVGLVAPALARGLDEAQYTVFHLPQLVTFRRSVFVRYAGGSSFAPDATFHDFGDLVAFLPNALGHALYAPLPWELFTPGETGVFKTLSGAETLLMLALTPFVVLAIVPSLRARRFEVYVFLVASLILFLALGLIVPNIGALFRLRLQALIPLLVVVAAFGLPAAEAWWLRIARAVLPQRLRARAGPP